MKILFIHNAFFPYQVGGAEYSLLNRAKLLIARGYEVYVLTIAADGKDGIYDVEGITVYKLSVPWYRSHPYKKQRSIINKLSWHISPLILNFIGLLKIRRWIKKIGFDVLFVINTPGIPYGILMCNGISQINAIVADYNYICVNGARFTQGHNCKQQCLKCKLITSIKKPLLSKFNNLVYISEYVKGVYESVLPNLPGVVIYNGEDAREYKGSTTRLNSDTYIIGFIGQIKDSKGVDVLISAVELLRKKYNLELVIAGSVDGGARIEIDTSLSWIRWMGHVEKDDFFNKVDLVVVPSKWNEPLGRVPFESSLRSIPVVVSNRGGLPETVHSIENVFDIAIQDSICKVIERHVVMSKVDKDYEIKTAYQFALDRFSTSKSVKQYERLICE
jgi:glycosyltransferase involved in cell wall biosynthesis